MRRVGHGPITLASQRRRVAMLPRLHCDRLAFSVGERWTLEFASLLPMAHADFVVLTYLEAQGP